MIAWDGETIGGANNYIVSGTVSSDAYAGTDTPTSTGEFKNTTFENSSWKPIAVPEPSTAALALAGLALLLKRRKA